VEDESSFLLVKQGKKVTGVQKISPAKEKGRVECVICYKQSSQVILRGGKTAIEGKGANACYCLMSNDLKKTSLGTFCKKNGSSRGEMTCIREGYPWGAWSEEVPLSGQTIG